MKLMGKKKDKEEEDSAQNEEAALLEDSLSSSDNEAIPAANEIDDEFEEKNALDGVSSGGSDDGGDNDDKDKNDEDDISSELMDIFTSEEAETGTDLGAFADILEDVNINSLLEEAKKIETQLRNLLQAAQ